MFLSFLAFSFLFWVASRTLCFWQFVVVVVALGFFDLLSSIVLLALVICVFSLLWYLFTYTLCPLCSLTKLNVSQLKALQPKKNHPIQWSCFQASDPYSGNILLTASKMDLSLLCGFWYILCNVHALRRFLILSGICKELVQVFGVYLLKDAKISALLEKATYLEGFSKLMFFKILRNFQPKVSHFILKWITVN